MLKLGTKTKELWNESKLFQAASLFIAWAFFVSFFSFYLMDSLIGAAKLFVYFLAFVLVLLCPAGEAKKSINLFFIGLTMISALAAVNALYQYLVGCEQLAKWDDPNFLVNQVRVYSFFGNPNLYAAFILAVIPMNFKLLSDKIGGLFEGMNQSNLIWVMFLATSFFLNTIVLFLTGSRSAIIAFLVIVSVALVIFFSSKVPMPLKFIAIPVLIYFSYVLLDLNPEIFSRIKTVFLWDKYSTNDYRLNVWATSLTMIKENWTLGIGVGTEVFRKIYALYMKPGYEALSAYSIYLAVAVQMGLAGLALFLNLLFRAFQDLIELFKGLAEQDDKKLILAMATCFAGLLIAGLFDTIFFRPAIQLVFWVLLASIVKLKLDFKKA